MRITLNFDNLFARDGTPLNLRLWNGLVDANKRSAITSFGPEFEVSDYPQGRSLKLVDGLFSQRQTSITSQGSFEFPDNDFTVSIEELSGTNRRIHVSPGYISYYTNLTNRVYRTPLERTFDTTQSNLDTRFYFLNIIYSFTFPLITINDLEIVENTNENYDPPNNVIPYLIYARGSIKKNPGSIKLNPPILTP